MDRSRARGESESTWEAKNQARRLSRAAACPQLPLSLLSSPRHVLSLFSLPSPMPNLADSLLASGILPKLPYHYTHYVQNVTPLSSTTAVVAALATYLAVIFGLREVMKSQKPMKLQFLFQLHNMVLSSGSLLLLVLFLEEIVPIVWKHGVFHGLCSADAWTPVRVVDPYLQPLSDASC